MKRYFFVITSIFISFIIKGQVSPSEQHNKIIIQGDLPPVYTNNSIQFRSIPTDIAGIGYNKTETQIDSLDVKNGQVKWVRMASEPLFVSGPLINRPSSHIGTRMEPGDSIYIRYEDGNRTITGKGFEKLELINILDSISDSLALFEKKMPYVINSLKDYIDWHSYLNKKIARMLPIIEAYKSRISDFAYNNIKADVLTSIEVTRVSKFNALRGSMPSEKELNKDKELVNQFGLSDRQLIEIYDSTMHGPAAQWIEHKAPYVNDPYYLLYKVRMEAYRQKGTFFIKEEADYSVLGSKTQYWVTLYNLGKKKYTGRTREEVLSYLFWFVRGVFYYCQFEPEIEEILADYYAQSKYPEFSSVVKEAELKFRERYSRRVAADFVLTDINNKHFTKDALKKKVAILDFWFTGCIGCVEMVPALQKVKDHFKNDTNVVFLNISIDKEKEKWIKSIGQKKYTTGEGLNLYTGGHGKDHDVIKKYGVTGYPTLYIIDPFDKVLWANTIPDPRKDGGKQLIALIQKQLTLLKDGPYILYEDKVPTAYSVHGGSLSSKKLNTETASLLQVQTDKFNQTFSVSLQSALTTPPSEYPKPEKLLVLSDIEGNFDAFRKLLQANKVIDENFNWIFGNGHLIFAGDMFDRGAQVTECLWLVYSLEEKARVANGYVHFILGNHEIMNMKGNHHYVHKKYEDNAVLIRRTLTELYNENSELGRWLRTKNIIEKVGDLLFTHGGISRKLNETPVTIAEINQLAKPFYGINRKDYGGEKINTIMSDQIGPFWYRGYYKGKAAETIVDSTLQKFNVKHIITGHTIVADTISIHYNGKVINTDTKHAKGISEALLMEGNSFYRVNMEGKKVSLVLLKPKPGIEFYSTE